MDDNEFYLVKKDGRSKDGKAAPWLLNYQHSGFREYRPDGTLKEVLTCVWGTHVGDAMPFDDKKTAGNVAKTIGGCIVVTAKRKRGGDGE